MSAQRHEKWGGGIVKQASDLYTRDLIDKPKRGRPRKPDAMTDAQRARAYRARQRAKRTTQAQPETVTNIPWWKDPANKVSRFDGLTASERAALRK